MSSRIDKELRNIERHEFATCFMLTINGNRYFSETFLSNMKTLKHS